MSEHRWSNKVLTDIKAVIDLRTMRYRWMSDLDYEKAMKKDASELVDFLRDHRSRDVYSIDIEPTYTQLCQFCSCTAEADAITGEPWCCSRAMEHWDADQYCALTQAGAP